MMVNVNGKTILYVGFFSLPDRDAAANRVFNNAKALSANGYSIVFVDEQTDYPYENFSCSRHKIGEWDAWSSQRPSGLVPYIRKMFSIRKIQYVIKQYERIDAVIAYNYPSVALYRLRRWCNRLGIRVVADCTEWYSGQEYRFPFNIFCSIDSWLRMVVVHRRLSGVICISTFLYNYYKNSVKVLFVPPLTDLSNAKWTQERVKFDERKVNIVYAGNPGKSKELLFPILECLHKSINKHNLYFRIIGITKSQFLDIYPQSGDLVRNLKDCIEFYGRLPHNETVRMIASSNYMIFLRPQNRVSAAGFSTKFVDSITCGTAVITNNTGDLKLFVDKIGQGFVVDTIDQLRNLFDMDLALLKDKGCKLDKLSVSTFDYNNYVDLIGMWFQKLFDG